MGCVTLQARPDGLPGGGDSSVVNTKESLDLPREGSAGV
jgi:hypothetical protein